MENIPRIHNIWPLEHVQKFMKDRQCDPEQFDGRIVIIVKLPIVLADFLAVVGHSWDLDQKRNGAELVLMNLMEFGTKVLQK